MHTDLLTKINLSSNRQSFKCTKLSLIIQSTNYSFSSFKNTCSFQQMLSLLLHHFLLIARYYIYICKIRNTIPMVQAYTQLLVIRSKEIEKQFAFDNNNLASFRKKWATFKQCPSEYNLTNTVN